METRSIIVTPAEVRKKKEELIGKNKTLRDKISRLDGLEKTLNTMWSGEANTNFDKAFQTDKVKMDNFCTAIDEYCNQLESIVKNYEATEAKVAKIASDRTYGH